MVKHIVLYTLKEGVNKEETVEIMSNALESLMGRISGLNWMEVNAVHHGGMDVVLQKLEISYWRYRLSWRASTAERYISAWSSSPGRSRVSFIAQRGVPSSTLRP